MAIIEDLQTKIATERESIGKRFANPPQLNIAGDPELANLRGEHAAKVRELFEHDSNLATVNFQPKEAPGPHAEGYVPPEQQIIDPTIGLRASSQQTMATADELVGILGRMGQRKDFLTDAYEKGLRAFDLGTKIKQMELSSLHDELNAAIKIQEMEDKRKEEEGERNSSADLTTLLNAITGFQTKKKAVTPPSIKQGVTKSKSGEKVKEIINGKWTGKKIDKGLADVKAVYAQAKQKDPNAKLDYSKNPDGSYTYNIYVPRESQQYLEESEREAYGSPDETLREMLATTIAVNPDITSNASTLFKTLVPQEGSSTEGEKKRAVTQEAWRAKENGETIDEIKKYIISQGYDPFDVDFLGLYTQ